MWLPISILIIVVAVVGLIYYTTTGDIEWNWNAPIQNNGFILSIIAVVILIASILVNMFIPWLFWLLLVEVAVAIILVMRGTLDTSFTNRNVFLWFFLGNIVILAIAISTNYVIDWFHANS